MNIEDSIQKQFSLAELSTYKIGGPAEYFIAVKTEDELKAAVVWAKDNALTITVLGGGSNILISDNGIRGLVIKLDNDGIAIDGMVMTVGASAQVWDAAELAFTKTLAGIEWSIGIPGSMGGAIRGNAGAHGGSFDTVVREVTAFNTDTLEFVRMTNEQCHFAYRHSVFKEVMNLIVWETIIDLKPGDHETLATQIEGYKEFRRTSQPKEPSAGCVFKNFLAADIEKVNPEVVAMAQSEGKVRGGKIGAGYLVQKLGLMGTTIGQARISDKHANFVVNDGGAKAADVAEIMRRTKEKVKAEYGIEMEEEVQFLGF